MNALLVEIYSTVVPSAPYIIAAYVLIMVVFFVWLFMQFTKQKKLDQQLSLLEEELADVKKAASKQ